MPVLVTTLMSEDIISANAMHLLKLENIMGAKRAVKFVSNDNIFIVLFRLCISSLQGHSCTAKELTVQSSGRKHCWPSGQHPAVEKRWQG